MLLRVNGDDVGSNIETGAGVAHKKKKCRKEPVHAASPFATQPALSTKNGISDEAETVDEPRATKLPSLATSSAAHRSRTRLVVVTLPPTEKQNCN